MKFLFITGSRGEWGYIRPIIKEIINSPKHQYSLVVTNMHLAENYGKTVNEIISDGIKVHHYINSSLDGYSHLTQAKSNALIMIALPDIFEIEKPDWVILAGDRGEQLVSAVAASYSRIPVAHIQAGERSGNIDGMARHAIGKLSNVHFASNRDAYDRLIKLGEEIERVHEVGAPQLDELLIISEDLNYELENSISIESDYCLVVFHPVTEAKNEDIYEQVKNLILSLNEFDLKKILIYPNNDPGSSIVISAIDEFKQGDFIVNRNLSRFDYLYLLKNAKFIIGNSSSGILEAPFFNIPTINLGNRQDGRERSKSVIDSDFDLTSIRHSINIAISNEFKDFIRENNKSLYGDGKSTTRILRILSNTVLNEGLLNKRITY
jgi:GDP/UDP-N,N'-diacetylbacillosamine 2-epimerase (hydrolysing)